MHTCPQSPSKCISETEDQSPFAPPNKIASGPHYHSHSTDSRCSVTPLDTLLYGSFSYPGPKGMGHGSVTPATNVARLQRVTSSMWKLPGPFSPTLPPSMDTLSAEQVVEIYQLATECQALGVELTKQFQDLCRLEAMHCAMAQATAHETINVGHMAPNAAFSMITGNQPDRDHEKFLHQFCAEAWKDTNDVIFSHQLKYDAQLMAFITTTRAPSRQSGTKSGATSTALQKHLVFLTRPA